MDGADCVLELEDDGMAVLEQTINLIWILAFAASLIPAMLTGEEKVLHQQKL